MSELSTEVKAMHDNILGNLESDQQENFSVLIEAITSAKDMDTLWKTIGLEPQPLNRVLIENSVRRRLEALAPKSRKASIELAADQAYTAFEKSYKDIQNRLLGNKL